MIETCFDEDQTRTDCLGVFSDQRTLLGKGGGREQQCTDERDTRFQQ
jgi:hypothetical protein